MLIFNVKLEAGWRPTLAPGADCMIYEEEPPRLREVGVSSAGTGCWPLPFLEFKSEPEPERDQACPCAVAPGFQAVFEILSSGTLSQD